MGTAMFDGASRLALLTGIRARVSLPSPVAPRPLGESPRTLNAFVSCGATRQVPHLFGWNGGAVPS